MSKALPTPDDLAGLENRFDGPIPDGMIVTADLVSSNEGRLAEIGRIIASRTDRILEATDRIAKAEQELAILRRQPYDPSDVRPNLIRAGIDSDKRCIRSWNDDIIRLEAEAQDLCQMEWDAMQRELVEGAVDEDADLSPALPCP